MKESCRKGLTSHPDPESCAVGRKGAREALTGAHAGRVLSCEIKRVQRADAVALTGGYLPRGVLVSRSGTLRSQRPRACMETPRARTGRPQRCPPRSMVGRLAKAASRTANVYIRGESDGCVLPTKGPNNDGGMASAEGLEGRHPTKENTRHVHPHAGLSAGQLCVVWAAPCACGRTAVQRCSPPPASEVGAVCGNAARTDLCGGRRATGVPTATQ